MRTSTSFSCGRLSAIISLSAAGSRLRNALMVVVVEQFQRAVVLPDHVEQRLGLVARDVAPCRRGRDQPHGLVQVAQTLLVDRVMITSRLNASTW